MYSFYRFPKDDMLLKECSIKCKRNDQWNPNQPFICSDHFDKNDFARVLNSEKFGYVPKRKKLKPGAIPTLNLPIGQCLYSKTTIRRNN